MRIFQLGVALAITLTFFAVFGYLLILSRGDLGIVLVAIVSFLFIGVHRFAIQIPAIILPRKVDDANLHEIIKHALKDFKVGQVLDGEARAHDDFSASVSLHYGQGESWRNVRVYFPHSLFSEDAFARALGSTLKAKFSFYERISITQKGLASEMKFEDPNVSNHDLIEASAKRKAK